MLGKYAHSLKLQIPAYEMCTKGRGILKHCRTADAYHSSECENHMRRGRHKDYDVLVNGNRWFSSTHLNKADRSIARPKYSLYVAEIRRIEHTDNAFKNGFVYLGDQSFPKVQQPVARATDAAFLSPKLHEQQINHLYHNVPRNNLYPHSLIW